MSEEEIKTDVGAEIDVSFEERCPNQAAFEMWTGKLIRLVSHQVLIVCVRELMIQLRAENEDAVIDCLKRNLPFAHDFIRLRLQKIIIEEYFKDFPGKIDNFFVSVSPEDQARFVDQFYRIFFEYFKAEKGRIVEDSVIFVKLNAYLGLDYCFSFLAEKLRDRFKEIAVRAVRQVRTVTAFIGFVPEIPDVPLERSGGLAVSSGAVSVGSSPDAEDTGTDGSRDVPQIEDSRLVRLRYALPGGVSLLVLLWAAFSLLTSPENSDEKDSSHDNGGVVYANFTPDTVSFGDVVDSDEVSLKVRDVSPEAFDITNVEDVCMTSPDLENADITRPRFDDECYYDFVVEKHRATSRISFSLVCRVKPKTDRF